MRSIRCRRRRAGRRRCRSPRRRSAPTTWAARTPATGAGARACLRGHHLPGAGLDGRPRLRHGRSLDGPAGALRRRIAEPWRDVLLRDPGGRPRARGDAPHSPASRGPRPHRRGGRTRRRPGLSARPGAPLPARQALLRRNWSGSATSCARRPAPRGRANVRREEIDERIAHSEELIVGVEAERRRSARIRRVGVGTRSAPIEEASPPARRRASRGRGGARAARRRAR